jgi:hypothetical protein
MKENTSVEDGAKVDGGRPVATLSCLLYQSRNGAQAMPDFNDLKRGMSQ